MKVVAVVLVGVPFRTPVLLFKLRPAGRVVELHTIGVAVVPLCVNVWL